MNDEMITIEELNEKGFYKVGQSGGGYVTGLFFNPVTKETKTFCLRDYDYSDCSRDNDSLYYAPINEELKKEYQKYVQRQCGLPCIGDTVEVVKGRKIPKGTQGIVKSFRDVKDRYGRFVAQYVICEDFKTNVNNVKIIKEVSYI